MDYDSLILIIEEKKEIYLQNIFDLIQEDLFEYQEEIRIMEDKIKTIDSLHSDVIKMRNQSNQIGIKIITLINKL